ncbi:MAG: biopolymer transporter ExbD [bacterium]|jgi:biopolymer transport protein ExbD
MGFKPSKRRTRPEYNVDLNLAPLMSLFVALIPILLLTAIFQRVGIVNLYLPTAEEARSQGEVPQMQEDFTLTVSITPKEISLRRDDRILYRDSHPDSFDLPSLRMELVKIKEKTPGKTDLVLLLDGSILYQTIIEVMDLVREHDGMELFPDISLADRVIEVNR